MSEGVIEARAADGAIAEIKVDHQHAITVKPLTADRLACAMQIGDESARLWLPARQCRARCAGARPLSMWRSGLLRSARKRWPDAAG